MAGGAGGAGRNFCDWRDRKSGVEPPFGVAQDKPQSKAGGAIAIEEAASDSGSHNRLRGSVVGWRGNFGGS